MSETNIKPCPFCGAVPDMEDPDTCYPNGFGWAVMDNGPDMEIVTYHHASEVPKEQWCYVFGCNNCPAEVNADNKEEAIAAWNRRPE